MIILTLLLVFVVSLLGLGTILYKKIPDLVNLPDDSPGRQPEDFMPKIKNGLGKLPGTKTINYELHLQKMLSKIRILTLKTESKTGNWLEQLRQKSNQKNNHKPDTYWDELKKTKDGD